MEVYPEITGALCANSHPGSYTGQDAYNDMLPVIQNSSGGVRRHYHSELLEGSRNEKWKGTRICLLRKIASMCFAD